MPFILDILKPGQSLNCRCNMHPTGPFAHLLKFAKATSGLQLQRILCEKTGEFPALLLQFFLFSRPAATSKERKSPPLSQPLSLSLSVSSSSFLLLHFSLSFRAPPPPPPPGQKEGDKEKLLLPFSSSSAGTTNGREEKKGKGGEAKWRGRRTRTRRKREPASPSLSPSFFGRFRPSLRKWRRRRRRRYVRSPPLFLRLPFSLLTGWVGWRGGEVFYASSLRFFRLIDPRRPVGGGKKGGGGETFAKVFQKS